MQEMTVSATVDNIEVVTEFVNAELERLGCGWETVCQVDIAVDELFGNIARYAYGAEAGPVTVQIEAVDAPTGVILTFIDRGIPYNPLLAKAPDVTLKPGQRPVGGLGIYMVKKRMDGMEYSREDGCNKLSIRKNYEIVRSAGRER